MAKQPWEIPDIPQMGDASNEITFAAIGEALSQWEYFEANLSLAFSYLLGSGYGNVAAQRAYGSVESFRGRSNLIQEAAEVYFRQVRDETTCSNLTAILKRAKSDWSARRNEIAHGIVQPWFLSEEERARSPDSQAIHKGFVLLPAYYATRKLKLPDTPPLMAVSPTYIYSSVEIKFLGKEFGKLADGAIDVLTNVARNEQGRNRG
jgi:hypothetical protein